MKKLFFERQADTNVVTVLLLEFIKFNFCSFVLVLIRSRYLALIKQISKERIAANSISSQMTYHVKAYSQPWTVPERLTTRQGLIIHLTTIK